MIGMDRRQFLRLSALPTLGVLAGCESPPNDGATPTESPTRSPTETVTEEPGDETVGSDVRVKQEPGKLVYWVLPGPRTISEETFGTPSHPLRTGEIKTQLAEGATEELFKNFPIMAGLPLTLRQTNEEDTAYTQTAKPTPVSNTGRIVSGQFDIIYADRQPYDLPGRQETADAVALSTRFTDPKGNEYRMQVKDLYKPPFPGFESGGGVVTNEWIHGTTGTDSPLFPLSFAHGAFWGVGDLIVNGKVVDENKWIHFMTTQIMRQQDYELSVRDDLPLKSSNTIAGKLFHTHAIVRPITITDDGPTFEPVNTAFTLPNGKTQPFIHVMFEQNTLVKNAFKGWSWPTSASPSPPTAKRVSVKQNPGNLVHWGLPGKRRLSPLTFGIPDRPLSTVTPTLEEVSNAAVEQLLREMPTLIGVPPDQRETNDANSRFTRTTTEVPFSGKSEPTSGSFEATYIDRRPYDIPGIETPDEVDMTATFTDPDGNDYTVTANTVIQLPVPNTQSGGGVVTGAHTHGTMTMGTPLLPRAFTYAGFWGVGNVSINGAFRTERHLVHMMTTQNIRHEDGRLATVDELPLQPEATIGGQRHHTHLFVFPVEITSSGPQVEPVPTEFTLPNGETQQFIHAIWEQDILVDHPFKGWPNATKASPELPA